jgi:hypothetical protein
MNRPQMTRHGVYRRRLALAAVASLALHLLLAKGLAITHMGLDVDQTTDTAASKPLTPKRKADFPLAVPRSPSREPLAHERPLDVPLAAPARPKQQPPRPQPDRTVADRRPDEPTEWQAASTPSAVRPSAQRDTRIDQSAAPARTAAAAAPAAAAQADQTAVAAATAAAPAKAPLPGATPDLPRVEPVAIASRWRPREVALLERLTAQPTAAVARPSRDVAAGEPAARSASALARQSTAASDAADAESAAESIALPAAATDARLTAAPAARARDRASSTAGSAATRSETARDDGLPAAAAASRVNPAAVAAATGRTNRGGDAASAVGGSPAAGRQQARLPAATGAAESIALPAASASGGGGVAAAKPAGGGLEPRPTAQAAVGSGRGRSATGTSGGDSSDPPAGIPGAAGSAASAGITASGKIGAADRTGDGPREATGLPGGGSPARAEGLTAAGAAGGSGLVAVAAAGGGAAAAGGGPAAAPMPAAIGRSSAAVAAAAGGAAAVRSRGGESDEEEGLSVSAPDADDIGPAGRRENAEPGAAPTAAVVARVAAVVLPAEGRVRDVAEAFARRASGNRVRMPTDAAGDKAATRARVIVDRGLDFLARSQQADGRWTLDRFAGADPADAPKLRSDTAATGLALLSFLGAGHDHFDGPHKDTVRRGLQFLLSVQKPDGDLYLPADELSNSCSWLYSHGIAAIALCEAVGMTGDPLVKPAAEKACGFIASSQHPTRGGWRYTPRSDADLSVSGWMLVAVRSGQLAGVKTDPRTLEGVRTLLDASASASDPTRYAYNPRNPQQRPSQLSSTCMTAVGTLMRLHTGGKASDPQVVAGGRALAAVPPEYGSGDRKVRDSYLWYYASQVLVHTGGPEWDAWYARLVDTLAAAQETAGPKAGSWNPLGSTPDRWGLYGGRIYVTALHLLALEVPDRHLPTYSAP